MDLIYTIYFLYFFLLLTITTNKIIIRILGFTKMDWMVQWVFVTNMDLKYTGPPGPLYGPAQDSK